MALPELYKDKEFQRQSFDRDSEFRRLYGVNASRGDARKFNRYWNSEQRLKDEKAFNAAQDEAEVAHIKEEAKKRAASWDARAAAVKEQNDARINAAITNINTSLAAKPVSQPVSQPVAKTLTSRSEVERNELKRATAPARSAVSNPASQKSIGRDIADDIPVLGSIVTGRDFFNNPTKDTATAFGKRLAWDTIGAPLAPFRVVKGLWDGVKGWWNSLPEYQHGGSVYRFQQGGAAPQQDVKAQVVALVQAAMQGDQKATQQVNQIMEAAKAGDQQAIQIAQIMEQVIKELQGQATSAKWGSKLNYVKSLKYARGGKTCPACEKKVEMKACGGKKAKKRYFGGLV